LEAHDAQLELAKLTQQTPGIATQLVNFFGTKFSNTISPPLEIDPWFQQKTIYINTLETQINSLGNAYASLVTKRQEISEVHKVIAATSNAISLAEKGSDRELSDAFDGFSSLQNQLQSLNHELAVESKITFEDVLRDYSRMIASSKEMLEYRNERMGMYQESVAISKINPALETQTQSTDKSKDSFENISNTCKEELQRFESTKTKELSNAISLLVQTNINHQVRVANLWKTFFFQVNSD